jgi:hypothetical protein
LEAGERESHGPKMGRVAIEEKEYDVRNSSEQNTTNVFL